MKAKLQTLTARELQVRLRGLGNAERGKAAERFFKTAPGESGAGLRFLGLGAATLRATAKEYRTLPLPEIAALLQSEWHDERGVALLIMTLQFPRADAAARKQLFEFYLAHTAQVNSWALVDCSAPHIVGAHLLERSTRPLDKLAKSKSLWERRNAIVATQHFIRNGRFDATLRIARVLLNDREDLIHKAVGWMLREVGDRDPACEEGFLREHYRSMPRTMLRYAIEKFPEKKRKAYLAGTI
jgi:3-methyladenine DNA glycosylase AlkD